MSKRLLRIALTVIGSIGAVAAPGSHVQPLTSVIHARGQASAPLTARPDPVLRPVSAVIATDAGPARLFGEHFDEGLMLTIENEFYVFTFGPRSLSELSSTSLQFATGSLEDGTYIASVRNPSGRRSNEVTLKVRRK